MGGCASSPATVQEPVRIPKKNVDLKTVEPTKKAHQENQVQLPT
jgi:hypothetical protein